MNAMRRTRPLRRHWQVLPVILLVMLSACQDVCGQENSGKSKAPLATISFGEFAPVVTEDNHQRRQLEEPIPPPPYEVENAGPFPEGVQTPSETPNEPVTNTDFETTVNPDAQRATGEPPTVIPVVHKENASISTEPKEDVYVIQAGCSSCGTGSTFHSGIAGDHLGNRLFTDACGSCGSVRCFPGQESCSPCCHHETAAGRFLCGLYRCICCPDPCYDGKWIPIADSAYFVECARPVTQTRLRWDSGVNYRFPDRSEFFIARADGMGRGPRPVPPAIAIPRLRYNQLNLYTEVASGKTGVIVEIPYRALNPDFAPTGAGFADMNTAIKTFLFDCELIQVSFQMRTYIPIGQTQQGLGVGHVSLEPSLIFGIKLHEDGYLQGQIAEWIPIGGDTDFAGAVFHYHFAVNQVLYRLLPEVPLVGTLELNGYVFQDGAFSDPILGQRNASETTHVSLGVGLRLFVCDRIDFGLGFAAALTENHMEDQLYRSEFRFRY